MSHRPQLNPEHAKATLANATALVDKFVDKMAEDMMKVLGEGLADAMMAATQDTYVRGIKEGWKQCEQAMIARFRAQGPVGEPFAKLIEKWSSPEKPAETP